MYLIHISQISQFYLINKKKFRKVCNYEFFIKMFEFRLWTSKYVGVGHCMTDLLPEIHFQYTKNPMILTA